MNNDMLRNIEYLREKADVSYEEAATLLDQFDGNVMRVLVELERQGKVYATGNTQNTTKQKTQTTTNNEHKEKATSFINRAFAQHLVVESGKGDKKKTVVDLSVPYCIGAAVVAPHLTVASVALAFICGYRVKLKKDKTAESVIPDTVETFVDKTVSNIKTTATSLGETVRGEKSNRNDDDDEGGEVTIE